MKTQPRLLTRVNMLEHQQTILETQFDEFSQDTSTGMKQLEYDMKASFDQLAVYHGQTEKQIDARFNEVNERFNKRFEQVEVRLDKVEARLGNIETLLIQILARLPEHP
jgi:hypothetical protein